MYKRNHNHKIVAITNNKAKDNYNKVEDSSVAGFLAASHFPPSVIFTLIGTIVTLGLSMAKVTSYVLPAVKEALGIVNLSSLSLALPAALAPAFLKVQAYVVVPFTKVATLDTSLKDKTKSLQLS